MNPGEGGGPLEPRRARLVRLSAALSATATGGPAARGPGRKSHAPAEGAGARESGVGTSFDAALRECGEAVGGEDLRASEVEEALLQSYLFLGYPAALTALARWRDLDPGPAPGAAGDGGPGADPLARPERVEAWTERGEEVCRVVYGEAYPRLRENVRDLHPDLDHWMVTEGYGKVLGRPGLDLATRELCVVAILAVGDREPQLRSHLLGALNAGATADQVEEALKLVREVAGESSATERAWELWRRIRARRDAGRDGEPTY